MAEQFRRLPVEQDDAGAIPVGHPKDGREAAVLVKSPKLRPVGSTPTAVATLEWLTTAPNPKWTHKTCESDDGQRGWRVHAVMVSKGETFADIKHRAALCGLTPGTGWGLDMFVERKCARCERAVVNLGAK